MISRISVHPKQNNGLVIKKTNLEWWIICLVFIFSFINSVTLFISLILLLILLKQKEIGTIKILNLITMRTIINPGLAVGIDSFQNIKWMIIYLCSFYLIWGYKHIDHNIRKRLDKILLAISFYTIYSAFASFFFSTLPIVAIFKLLSYSIVFIALIIGVANTNTKYNWLDWMYSMMVIIFIGSIPFIALPVGYLINGHAFQGITNQPNMFGILGGLFTALIVSRIQLSRFNGQLKPLILLSVLLYMIILSKSRTGFITAVLTIMLFLFFSKINRIQKIIMFNFYGLITILYALFDGRLIQFIHAFLYKGNEDILFSRVNQVDGLIFNFLRNPWFGSGFAVPVTPYRSFGFSTEYIVEPGNLILALLSYGGIFGFALFLNYMFKLINSNKKNYKFLIFLPLSTIFISMGEMVFFSSNNIGIWLYMMLSIYIYDGAYLKMEESKIESVF